MDYVLYEYVLVPLLLLGYCIYRCATLIVSILGVRQYMETRKSPSSVVRWYYTFRLVLAVIQFPVHLLLTWATFAQLFTNNNSYHRNIVRAFFQDDRATFTSMVSTCNIALVVMIMLGTFILGSLPPIQTSRVCKWEMYTVRLWIYTLVYRWLITERTLWVLIH